ncbi:hypothetical protein GGR57DRAFT_504374 [Xylariaceae sp. FL1272]|nr:hypothetical protein GGR57DRAFT_504374 [Xylariaceae sp. FL1272]
MTIEYKKHDVSTCINYYRDPGDGLPPEPVRISDKTVKNDRPKIAIPKIIRDVSGDEDRYTLDTNGFQFIRHETKLHEADFHDGEIVEQVYYAEATQLLKDITGADQVHIFDHKVRTGPSNWHKLGEGNRTARGPLFRAHVDQSYVGAEIVLRRHFPDDAEKLLQCRYQIINIWRPLKKVEKDPFAVADAFSILDDDLIAASILYPGGDRDETWTITPNERHRWYYKYAQRPDEALLIKCFDSSTAPGLARRAPHSAFEDPQMADRDHRESIEVRALVLYR